MALPKTKNTISRRWPRRHFKFVGFVLIIALVVAGYFVYQTVALQMNRRDFKQARANIDLIYADIVSKVGQPDNSKQASDCSRSYQEFTGYGDTTCDIATSFIYSVNDESSASELFKKIQAVMGTHSKLLKLVQPNATAIEDKLVVNTYYHVASNSYRSNGLNCVANYVYDTPREISLNIKDQTKKPFQVTLGCYGPARALYYP